MKLGWDVNDLINDRDTLVALTQEDNDIRKVLYTNKVLNCINHYITLKHFSTHQKPSLKSLLNEDMLAYFAFERYHELISSFYFKLQHFHKPMSAIKTKLKKILGNEKNFSRLVHSNVSDDEALSLLVSFYNSFDDEIANIFSEIYNDDNFNIKFSKHEKAPIGEFDTDGYCIFIDILKKYYISVDKSNGVSKISNLIHEVGHALDCYYNPEKTYNETSYLFCEIASLFPEMVALFNNIGNRDKLLTNYELYCLLVTYYETSNALLLHQVIINKWKECNHKTNLKFYFSLKRDFNLSYSDIYEFLSHNLVNSGSYVLSFEACAELLYIYFVEDDKERALDIYKKILKADKNEDELFVILSELELGKNLNNIARMILMNFIKSIKEYEKNENMGLRLSR